MPIWRYALTPRVVFAILEGQKLIIKLQGAALAGRQVASQVAEQKAGVSEVARFVQ
jgi:hypothetical protein